MNFNPFKNLFLLLFMSSALLCRAQIQTKIKTDLQIEDLDPERISRLNDSFKVKFNHAVYKTAVKYADTLYQLSLKTDNTELQVRYLVAKAASLDKLGQYEAAIDDYMIALQLLDQGEIAPIYKVNVLINLGNTYNHITQYEKGYALGTQTLDIIDKHALPAILKANAHTLMLEALIAQKKYKEALQVNLKAEQIAKEFDDDLVLGIVTINKSEIFSLLGRFDEAFKAGSDVILFGKKTNSTEIISWGYLRAAEALDHMGRWEEAVDLAKQALKITKEQGYKDSLMKTQLLLAEIYTDLDQFELSNQTYKQYLETKEKYLETLSKAKQIEVNRTLAIRENIILKQKKSISYIILISVLLCLTLGVALWVFIKKKRKIQDINTSIIRDQKLLQNENQNLREKLEEYALNAIDHQTQTERSKNKRKHENLLLNPQQKKECINKLLQYMDKHKPYLQTELNQKMLAESVNLNVPKLSEVLNDGFQCNFNDFVNLYRINEAKKILSDPKNDFLNIEAIAYQSGFNSKTSFHRAFKKFVNKTPLEYRNLKIYS